MQSVLINAAESHGKETSHAVDHRRQSHAVSSTAPAGDHVRQSIMRGRTLGADSMAKHVKEEVSKAAPDQQRNLAQEEFNQLVSLQSKNEELKQEIDDIMQKMQQLRKAMKRGKKLSLSNEAIRQIVGIPLDAEEVKPPPEYFALKKEVRVKQNEVRSLRKKWWVDHHDLEFVVEKVRQQALAAGHTVFGEYAGRHSHFGEHQHDPHERRRSDNYHEHRHSSHHLEHTDSSHRHDDIHHSHSPPARAYHRENSRQSLEENIHHSHSPPPRAWSREHSRQSLEDNSAPAWVQGLMEKRESIEKRGSQSGRRESAEKLHAARRNSAEKYFTSEEVPSLPLAAAFPNHQQQRRQSLAATGLGMYVQSAVQSTSQRRGSAEEERRDSNQQPLGRYSMVRRSLLGLDQHQMSPLRVRQRFGSNHSVDSDGFDEGKRKANTLAGLLEGDGD